jgi:alpha-mannosidase
VRCFEATGRPTKATVNLAFAKTQWSGSFHPFEIKTLRINRNTNTVTEVNLLEQ